MLLIHRRTSGELTGSFRSIIVEIVAESKLRNCQKRPLLKSRIFVESGYKRRFLASLFLEVSEFTFGDDLYQVPDPRVAPDACRHRIPVGQAK